MLPVLPALLSAGATGGRRRPLGIVLGLAVTFTVTIVGLATVVDGVGLGDSLTRDLAIVALALFGLAVAIPQLGDRLEAPLSRLARFGPQERRPRLLVGHRWSARRWGSSTRRARARCSPRSSPSARRPAARWPSGWPTRSAPASSCSSWRWPAAGSPCGCAGRRLSRVLGGVMVLTAVAMAFQLDIRFQTAIADHLPAALVNPTNSLETSTRCPSGSRSCAAASPYERVPRERVRAGGLRARARVHRQRPLVQQQPLTIAGLEGRVVLIDFWTYTCINCIRTLPHLVAWDKAYRDAGLTIVGVHSPEFSFEKKASNVARALEQNGIHYPVAQDNELATWNAWSNQYWPAKYLIDATGTSATRTSARASTTRPRRRSARCWPRPGDESARRRGRQVTTRAPRRRRRPISAPSARERFLRASSSRDVRPTRPMTTSARASSRSAGAGRSRTSPRPPAGARRCAATCTGKDVYLVLSGPGTVDVTVDGKHEKTVRVTTQRLYHLLSRPPTGRARPAAALLARRRGLRVHVRVTANL